MNDPRVVALIPARLDSSRLPRKQLRRVGGEPLIEYLVDRVRETDSVDHVRLCTTNREVDDPLVDWARDRDLSWYRGHPTDVLQRLRCAAAEAAADVIVRANGDNPLQAPEVTDAGIMAMIENGREFVTGKNKFTGLPVGIGPTIYETDCLERIATSATDTYYREHIDPYLLEHPNAFDWAPIPVESSWIDRELRLTVDTMADFTFVATVIERLSNDAPHTWPVTEIIKQARRVSG
jgi:spore coat polysaccharide biosynthesis protein SpsF